MAMVTSKLLTPTLVIKTPLNKPMKPPSPSIKTMTSKGCSCKPKPPASVVTSIKAANMAVKPRVDSTDRSKLPVMKV